MHASYETILLTRVTGQRTLWEAQEVLEVPEDKPIRAYGMLMTASKSLFSARYDRRK